MKHKLSYLVSSILLILTIAACREKQEKEERLPASVHIETKVDSIEVEPKAEIKPAPLEDLADTTFVRLADYSDNFVYDLRYATENNFLKAKVYDCAEC